MSFQAPLISIPKKTTTDVDWTNPIRQVIAHSYGEDPKNYTEECAVLQRCRQDAVRGAGSDHTARDLIYKYFGQLELLELRFSEIKVSFPWNDAFTEKLTTQSALAFEKASIIHLLSSVLSSLAATTSRSDAEGLKRAYYNSRAAAGMLTYINDNFLHAPSTDLSREVIHFCNGVMTAQATEIFTEKLVDDKKAPALVSRSANQTAGMYAGLVEEMKEFQGKGVFDRNWLYVLQIKAKLFASLAHYYRATADAAGGKHGVALVRLRLADTAAQDALRQASGFIYSFVPSATPSLPSDAATSLQEITKAHAALCKEAKDQASKDNDLIYHDILPSEASLPPIDKLPPAAPITIQEIYANQEVSKLIGPDIFIRLVPLAVHESASVYSEEKAKLVRAENERVEISEGEVRAGLEHLGLPGLVASWRKIVDDDEDGGSGSDVDISGSLRRLAEDVRNGGALEPSVRQLDADRARCEQELRELTALLDNESRDCERMRSKYNPQFTQSPSGPHTAHFRSNISTNLGSLQSAASSDSQVSALWREIQHDVSHLAGGEGQLARIGAEVAAGKQVRPEDKGQSLLDLQDDALPGGGLEAGEKDGLKKAISDAAERLDRLSKIRRERDEVLKDLKEKIQTDDVSSLLLMNRRTQGVEPQLFATELEKFRPYQSRIASAVAAAQSILTELDMLVRQVEKGKGMKERQRSTKDRTRRLRDWERHFEQVGEKYSEVRAGLGKGLGFYESLNVVINELRREVKGFVSTREGERNRMVGEIEMRQRISGGSTSSAPPPPSKSGAQAGGSRGIDEQLAGMSLGGSARYGSASPLYPTSPPPTSAYNPSPGFPPPPPSSNPTRSLYSSPPPPPPQASSSNPYDFGSLSGLPSAFQSTSPLPLSRPSYTSPRPPPPQEGKQYPSYTYAPPSSASSNSYPAPPSRSSTQGYAGYPAPPSQSSQSSYPAPPPQQTHHASPPHPSQSYSYNPPPQSQSSYPPPPPPPAGQQRQPTSNASYYTPPPTSNYASPPPPPQPQYAYTSQPPPAQASYPSYAPPISQQAYPNAPPPGGYSGYQPPPSQPQSQQYGQGAYQYR